jgi:hypothetical protein
LHSEPIASRSGAIFFFEGEALTEASLTSTKLEEQSTGGQIQQMLQELQFSQSGPRPLHDRASALRSSG